MTDDLWPAIAYSLPINDNLIDCAVDKSAKLPVQSYILACGKHCLWLNSGWSKVVTFSFGQKVQRQYLVCTFQTIHECQLAVALPNVVRALIVD